MRIHQTTRKGFRPLSDEFLGERETLQWQPIEMSIESCTFRIGLWIYLQHGTWRLVTKVENELLYLALGSE